MNEVLGSTVVLVRWPEEAEHLERLRGLGIPRLLVVAPEEHPPDDNDPLSDWIRLPASDDDLWARVRALELRTRERTEQPVLTGDGRLAHRGRWVALSPLSERLAEVLLARYGAVATFDDLRAAGWPDGEVKRDVLRVRLTKLRETIEPLGLQIVGVRERGYVLQARDEGTEGATNR